MKPALLGILSLLITAFPLTAATADDEVGQMLTSFYKWYVPHLDQKPGAKSDHKMSDFATDRLIARINKLREPAEDGGVAKLDWDPYLNAQDYDADWGTNVKVSEVKVKGDNASATVRVGGKEGSIVRLVLVRSGGRWKIDNFVPKL